MRIGVLGATGPAGRALATRLASVGYEVVVGSRSLERAQKCRDELCGGWPDHELPIEAAENSGAAAADLIVVATPWDGAGPTVAPLAGPLAGKVVISMANALVKVGKEFHPLIPPRGSVAAEVQAAAPDALVSAAFHHVPAKELGEINEPVECDVLICSDHPTATEATAELVSKIPGLRAVDAGSLTSAGSIEALTAVLVGMNVRYRSRLSIRLTGLDD